MIHDYIVIPKRQRWGPLILRNWAICTKYHKLSMWWDLEFVYKPQTSKLIYFPHNCLSFEKSYFFFHVKKNILREKKVDLFQITSKCIHLPQLSLMMRSMKSVEIMNCNFLSSHFCSSTSGEDIKRNPHKYLDVFIGVWHFFKFAFHQLWFILDFKTHWVLFSTH